MALEGEHHALECQAIVMQLGAVASKVDFDAAPTQLRAQVRQAQ